MKPLLLLLVGCAPSLENNPLPFIYGGEPAVEVHHDAVVSLHRREGPYVSELPYCSGTAIRPDWVLTAAHCVQVDGVQWGGDRVMVKGPAGGVEVDDVVPYPYYEAQVIRGDLALLHLVEDLSVVLPDRIESLHAGVVDEAVEVVGFGVTENGRFGERRRVWENLAGFDEELLFTDQTDGSGACHGDSGGPVLLDGQVIGVTSFGDPDCLRYGAYTRVDAYADWVGAILGVRSEEAGPGIDLGRVQEDRGMSRLTFSTGAPATCRVCDQYGWCVETGTGLEHDTGWQILHPPAQVLCIDAEGERSVATAEW